MSSKFLNINQTDRIDFKIGEFLITGVVFPDLKKVRLASSNVYIYYKCLAHETFEIGQLPIGQLLLNPNIIVGSAVLTPKDKGIVKSIDQNIILFENMDERTDILDVIPLGIQSVVFIPLKLY